jgi:hypothetical protein
VKIVTMAKSQRRQKMLKQRTQKKAAKEHKMKKGGINSRYARKKSLQRRGIYSVTSPLYNPHFHQGIRPEEI